MRRGEDRDRRVLHRPLQDPARGPDRGTGHDPWPHHLRERQPGRLRLDEVHGHSDSNFAAAFDDAEMEISHVIRGDDHLSNTPRQILIHEALGNQLPTFAHVPQVLGPDKKKLSKRHGAASVEDFAERGYLPEALFNYLALLGAGYAADEEIFAPEELAERFRIDRVSGNPAILDEKKLRSVNAVYLRRKSTEDLAALAAPMLVESGAATEEELEGTWRALRRSWIS